jgi:hypothetical protein
MIDKSKPWPSAKCSTWLKTYADGVASDAYKMGGDDFLYSCAGVAYYAVSAGVGYNTKEQFINLILNHMKLGIYFLEDAIEEIES